MKSYTNLLLSAVSCAAFAGSVSLSRAEAPAAPAENTATISENWKSAPVEKLRDEINRVGEVIREKVGSSEESKRKLEVVWMDPQYTSEKIEEKRKKIREAEDTIIRAQVELREEVAKLPEVVKMSEQTATLQTEITSLRQQKKALIQLLGDRSKTVAPSN